jgi:hypothetical protein
VDTTSASSSWSTQGEQVKRSSKYVKNIHNLFITIVLIYIIIYIFILFLSFEFKIQWRKQKLLRCEQNKAIQKALSGFLMDEVIDPKGTYYFDPKEFIPSIQTTEDLGCKKSQGHEYICDFIMYIFHACTTS